jgi:hypothetical protein
VVAGRFCEEVIDKTHIQFSIAVEEIWFHDNACKESGFNQDKDPGNGGPLKNGPGYDIIAPSDGSKLEELRAKAYSGWLNYINLYQQPGPNRQPLGDEATLNPERVGTPPGEPINFGPKPQLDNRTQLALTHPDTFPATIDLQAHTQYCGWQLYRYITKYNLVKEWTSFRPHPNPKGANMATIHADGTKKGVWQTLNPDPKCPVHLILNKIYLLWGGMQLTNEGNELLPPDQEPYVHQMAHVDFASPRFEVQEGKKYGKKKADYSEEYPSPAESPLLRGLSHPATFNVAIETERSMWINNIANVVTFKKNWTVANSADTIHGGYAWNAHDYKDEHDKFLYKPSLHLVMGSIRFPQIPNVVKLVVSPQTYCPKEHVTKDLDLEDLFTEAYIHHQKTLKLLEVMSRKPHKDNLDDKMKELLEMYKPIIKKEKNKLKMARKANLVVEGEEQPKKAAKRKANPAKSKDNQIMEIGNI